MKAIGSKVWYPHDGDRNHATRIAKAVHTPLPPPDLGRLFAEAYPTFAPTCRAIAAPGLAIVAISESTGRVAGLAQLAAQPTQHTATIVGRHDACDLILAGSDDLSLRQLAVILDPVTSWQSGRTEVEYRILDLRTAGGFVDEQGRALRGLRCNGPSVLRFAGHALYLLPLGDPTDWPGSGYDAWACQPERVYFDELIHSARGSSTRVPNFSSDRVHRTRITAVRGPRETGAVLVTDGDLVGSLEVIGPACRELIQVGEAALRDGVLIGRYPRCDSARVDDESVSRVHALMIQIGDALMVVDTASTNGTALRDQPPSRLLTITSEAELVLGFETSIRWRWLS